MKKRLLKNNNLEKNNSDSNLITKDELREYLDFWYMSPCNETYSSSLLNDLGNLECSGIKAILSAYIIKCFKDQNVLSDNKLFLIKYGDNYKYIANRIFNTFEEAMIFAKNGPYIEEDEKLLFEKFKIVHI